MQNRADTEESKSNKPMTFLTFDLPTFWMSRWSCWETCQQGSPRTAVTLRRSTPPVRQETLLLANVSFIWEETTNQQRPGRRWFGR